MKIVHTAPWSHCPNKNVFIDRRNLFYNKFASFRCDGRLFHSLGPAAANAPSLTVLDVRVTTFVSARHSLSHFMFPLNCCHT